MSVRWPRARYALLLLLTALPGGATAQGQNAAMIDAGPEEVVPSYYDALFDVRIVPAEKTAHVELRVTQAEPLLKELNFRIDPERQLNFSGDGTVVARGDGVQWVVPEKGGTLRWTFLIDHLRNSEAYDARAATNWVLFRGDDLVPAARVRTRLGARSRSRLRISPHKGWTVKTPFPQAADGSYTVERGERKFDRPTGWILAGKLASLSATVAGCRVTLAAPVGQKVRRYDQLALLRWTLPALRDVVGELPPRILVVGADDPMLRGGLSGPGSVYLHADRPLIDKYGTSPLLHEILHVVMGARAGPDGDWIVEGLAELYSLELLARSKSISKRRRQRMLAKLGERAARAGPLRGGESSGDTTARAVIELVALNDEIIKRSGGEASLDDVVKALSQIRTELTTDEFREVAQSATGLDLASFFDGLERRDQRRAKRATKKKPAAAETRH